MTDNLTLTSTLDSLAAGQRPPCPTCGAILNAGSGGWGIWDCQTIYSHGTFRQSTLCQVRSHNTTLSNEVARLTEAMLAAVADCEGYAMSQSSTIGIIKAALAGKDDAHERADQ